MNFAKHNDKMQILLNKTNYGAISYFRVEFLNKPENFASATDSEKYYRITVKRRLGFDFSREVIDFYKSTGFEVSVTRDGRSKIYFSAKLESITEETADDRLLYQTMVFTTESVKTEAA